MLVTPRNKKFGPHAVGDVFELKDKVAKIMIKVGKVTAANPAQTYSTRDMRPAPTVVPVVVVPEVVEQTVPVVADASEPMTEEAPYGYKADGTPRKRPGRPAS
jgi:hypothetical protein